MKSRAVAVVVAASALNLIGCDSSPKTTGGAEASATAAAVRTTGNQQALEREVVGVMSKDRVAMRFRAILIWEPTKPDVVGAEPRKVDPAVVDALFASAIKEDLPKIIGDYRFGELVAVHDAQPTIAKVESRMADQLRARSAQTNAGVTVDKFVVRRLDLNESTQRQGMDDLQRQRLQEIWRGNTNTPLR